MFSCISTFTVISILVFLGIGRDVTAITIDFKFYHPYAHNFFGSFASQLSTDLYSSSPIKHIEWIPTPFYTLIFLSPITLFGSRILFYILGLIIGYIIIISIYRILNKDIFQSFSKKAKGIALFLFILNPYFLYDCISVSTNSVFACFILYGFATEKRIIRILCFIFAAMTRVNFIFSYFSLVTSLLIIRPKGSKSILRDSIPSLIIYTIFWILFYSTYPGNGLNYLFFTEGQGIDFLSKYSNEIYNSYFNSNIDIFYWKPNLIETIKTIIQNPKVLSFIFHSWAIKLSATLGFPYEYLFRNNFGYWLSKPIVTSYFILIMLPGLYLSLINLFSNEIDLKIKSIILYSLIFLSINSLFIGIPRYIIGTHLSFIIAWVSIIDFKYYKSSYLSKK
tara:strand:+ start:1061 stop:2239 length:1179 start_codon:yes stop_codon:yes gene_type:complete